MGYPREPTVAVLIPFFGRFPAWITYFVKTCAFNPTVTFIILTDCLESGTYDNVTIIHLDLAGFNRLASRKLGLTINAKYPYKICDLRPAFGLIFEQYLLGYDFWGHCDVDIILGDIRKFLNGCVLDAFDVITVRKEYLAGHFTLYRNTGKVNELFKMSADYHRVFESERAFAFDECNFLWRQLLAGVPVSDTRPQVDSMTHVVKRLAREGYINAYFQSHVLEQDRLNDRGQAEELLNRLIWNRGKLVDADKGTEYLSFHFHFLKNSPSFKIPDWEEIPDQFLITKSGFAAINPDMAPH